MRFVKLAGFESGGVKFPFFTFLHRNLHVDTVLGWEGIQFWGPELKKNRKTARFNDRRFWHTIDRNKTSRVRTWCVCTFVGGKSIK